MPVVLDTPARPAPGGDALRIGLLNNLGDAGMAMGERQWTDLLDAAADQTLVHLRLYSLGTIARGAHARARMAGRYHDGTALASSGLDGLIVTGAEPRTSDLRAEAFWPELASVVDWARTGTRSTIWSCLAAHAAVLHLDGVRRRPLAEKCSGVFDVVQTGDHPFLVGAPQMARNCHSRWNGLDEAELVAAGHTIVTRGAIGVDVFLRDEGSLFAYLQGHPEYDDGALARELRRDLARWRFDPSRPPAIPAGYLAAADEAALRAYVAAADVAASAPMLGPPPRRGRDLPLALGRAWLAHLGATTAPQITFRTRYRTTTLVPTTTRP